MISARSRSPRRSARQGRGGPGRRGDHGARSSPPARVRPGTPGRGQGRHPLREDRLRHQPALRLRPARRSHSASRRSATATARSSSPAARESMTQAPHCVQLRAGVKMGNTGPRRHDDQGRAVGMPSTVPHGQYGRERRDQVADHPRRAGQVRARLANKAEAAQKGGQVSRTRSSP